MRVERKGVFETNSSSMHSISISDDVEYYETIYPDENGIIILIGGEFGWEIEKYNDAWTKANYAAVDVNGNKEKTSMLKKVIREHTGAKEVKISLSCNWKNPEMCYIDHQSVGTSEDAFFSEDTLKNWIFNPKSWLKTDNDNH